MGSISILCEKITDFSEYFEEIKERKETKYTFSFYEKNYCGETNSKPESCVSSNISYFTIINNNNEYSLKISDEELFDLKNSACFFDKRTQSLAVVKFGRQKKTSFPVVQTYVFYEIKCSF